VAPQVLHVLAIARAAGVELNLDDFQAVSDRTPFLADLKPSGRFVMEDVHKARDAPPLPGRCRVPMRWTALVLA